MISSKKVPLDPRGPAGFTLIELLITVSIMAMMAGMILFALYSAQESAKEAKTKSIIAKLDSIIKAKWDSYKTRRMPINIQNEFVDANNNGVFDPGETQIADFNGNGNLTDFYSPQLRAQIRLDVLRDLLRMELPDRWSDIVDAPVAPFGWGATFRIARPSVNQGFLRRYNAGTAPTGEYAGAECLYMIVMQAISEDDSGADLFRPEDVADTDGDGFPEFVDGWKMPIKFLRWAPGFQFSELQVLARAPASGGASPITLTAASGAPFSTATGAYAGGTVMAASPPSSPDTATFYLDPTNAARITTTTSTGNAVTVTYVPPSGSPSFSSAVLLPPDPFDPRGVYSLTAAPSFATYPMIYSAGANKCYGVLADFSGSSPLHYSTVNLNPFYIGTDGVNGTKSLIGNCRDEQAEKNYVPSAWLDNIHNHMLNVK